jgi:hypothetical protein
VLLTLVALVVLTGAGVAVIQSLRDSRAAAPATDLAPPATAQVKRQTLESVTSLDGELGYGALSPIVSRQQGTLTWLPPVGETLTQGSEVLRANEQPVVLLYGGLPMYRALSLAVEGQPLLAGDDVLQFEQNLRELGYTGFTVDHEFTDKTMEAVKRWQHSLGVPETGVVDIGQVIYAPGPLRVADHQLRLGSDAAGLVMNASGTDRVVTADVPATQAGWAQQDAPVTITLPDGRAVTGTVAGVGTEASSSDGDSSGGGGAGEGSGDPGNATIRVTITIADQAALGTLQQGPVIITRIVDQRADVLAVPVIALLALAEGGYGVEVVEGAGSRIVPVETGMISNGQVEVRGPDLQVGQSVVVPG